MRFGGRGRRCNGDGDEGFNKPHRQPCARRSLSRRNEGRDDGRKAHGHTAPAGHGREFPRALHGLADVAQMVGGASVNGDGLAVGGAKRTSTGHGGTLATSRQCVKYFVTQSQSALLAGSGRSTNSSV